MSDSGGDNRDHSGHEDAGLRERFVRNAGYLGLDEESAEALLHVCVALALWVRTHRSDGHCFLLGVNGAQGSGKSTLCALLTRMLIDYHQLRTVHLSIDDFYLSRATRDRLAREQHPLFRTRGVPGTHDVALAVEVIRRLRNGQDVRLPRFDKAIDDLLPESEWPLHTGRADLILFEGWCVGARPQSEAELVSPLNPLEVEEDPEGSWRRGVNARLTHGIYRDLFDMLEGLVMLHAPDFASVARWRWQQEEELHAEFGADRGLRDQQELQRFLMHYERLTLHMLKEMPERADVVLYLDDEHRVERVRVAGARG